MIHLHRAITLVMVWLCVAHHSTAQQSAASADTTVCNAYMDSVGLYSYRYDANDSLRYFTEIVLACSEAHDDVESHMEALSVLGVTYLRDNNYPKALAVFQLNLEEAKAANDSTVQAQVYVNLATAYTSMDSVRKAMSLLVASAKLFEAKEDSFMLAYVYTNVGILFGTIREREEQLSYSRKAFAMGGGVVKNRHTLTLGANLAVNYLNSGIVDSAETLGLQVLEISRELKNLKVQTQILAHLANIANRKEEYDRAIGYCEEVLANEGKLKHDQTFASVYIYRGIALMSLERNAEAVESLEKGLMYAELENSLQRRELALRHLPKSYARSGQFEKAYETMVEFTEVSDSLSGEETVRILNDLETKYETEKKEQQLREANQQNQIAMLKVKQRNIWIAVVVALGLLVAGTIFFVSRQKLLKEQQQTLENRLLSLRVQMNPHFIFNALTAVQNYMLSGKDLREATKYLSNFAKVMRAFLEYNQDEQITLDKELNALDLYVGIQKLRFNNGFEFDVEVDDELVPEEVQVPPMILQPLIENAIEHGIRNLDDGKISLKYFLEDDYLVMEVSDNGVGRKRSAQNKRGAAEKTSLATKITEERISLLNRKGEGAYAFEVRDKDEDGTGTVVKFKIPLRFT